MDRKQRKRRDYQRQRAIQRRRDDQNYALANEFLTKAEPCEGLLVLKAIRVSGRSQKSKLKGQRMNLNNANEQLKYKFVGKCEHVGPGDELGWWKKVFKKARKRGAQAVLLETRQRVVRLRSNSGSAPRREQYEFIAALQAKYGIKQILTVLPPDASKEECGGYEKTRGHSTSGNKGGRGKKKPETIAKEIAAQKPLPQKCKEKCRDHYWKVVDMQTAGHSYSEIQQATGVDRMTAWRWIKAWEKGKSWPYHFSNENSDGDAEISKNPA